MKIRIGTRASQLARWQADWTAKELERLGFSVSIIPIITAGDRLQKGPVPSPPHLLSVGVFTKEIQQALLNGEIDLAVHSLKDLPTDAVPGLTLSAVPRRAAVEDVLVLSKDFSENQNPPVSLADLPPNAVLGTGSLRRRAQISASRPDLILRDIRGNLNRRLEKLDAGDFDALILAQAGLERLGWTHRISAKISTEIILPAVGQGALGLETRTDDTFTRQALAPLNDPETFACVAAERAMLKALDGGCTTPIGGLCRTENGELTLTGRVIAVNGREMVQKSIRGRDPQALGETLAGELLEMGAGTYIAEARGKC